MTCVPSDSAALDAAENITLPEIVMLLLFNPRNGTIAGEGLPLLYTLGGAMISELGVRGHIEIDEARRTARAVGDRPADPFLREAWDRLPVEAKGLRTLVTDIGTRSRESTLDRLVARETIRRVPRRLLGLIPTHSLEGGDTQTRDRLLGPVRSALIDGTEPDSRTSAVIAMLSAGGVLPAMHADIPWSGDVYTRGKEFERGERGAKAASDIIMVTAVVQVLGTVFATTLATLARPNGARGS